MAITKINTPELFDLGTTNSSLRLPSGDTASRPTNPNTGEWRYNTDDNYVEYWDGSAWFQIDYETVAPTCTTNTINYPSGTTNTAYYKMEDATDQTGNYNGTATNVNFNVAGKFGNAGEFNGSSSYISTGINFSTLPNTKSISMWIKSTGSSSVGFGGMNGSSNNNGLFTFDESAGNMAYIPKFGGYHTGNASTVITNAWNHFVVTDTNVNGNVKMYINGSEVTVTKVNSVVYTNNTDMQIGRQMRNNGATFWQTGSIDQVRIFPSALTSDQVTQLYNEVQCVPAIIPSDYFNPLLYTGNGGTQSINDLTFAPDFVWIKDRNTNYAHQLYDTVRGATEKLHSNTTAAEATDSTGLTSFDTNGFTVSTNVGINTNNNNYVAWSWKAGGAKVSNTDGDNNSAMVSANPDAGFSIITYTGNNANNSSVGHGLNQAPEMHIIKRRSTPSDWFIIHKDVNNYKAYLKFTTGAPTNDTNMNAPTDSVIRFNTSSPTFNGSSQDWLIYAFHSVDGMSDIGSYVGTGAVGNTIVTGFRPAFLMTKRTDTGGTDWHIWDSKRNPSNPVDDALFPNEAYAEADYSAYPNNFLSNGFSVDTTNGAFNANGGSYIFLAIAEEVYNANAVTANQTNPFNDGSQIAQYEFEGNATDSQPNGYIGKGGTFNGSSSKITTPVLSVSSTSSVSMWLNSNNTTATERRGIIEINVGTSGYAGTFSINYRYSDGEILVRSGNSTSSQTTILTHFDTSLRDGNWHNLILTRNESTGVTVLYIDGTQADTETVSFTSTVGDLTYIGDRAVTSAGDFNWDGSIDQVRIYNTALNPNDVWLLYNETSATSSTLDYPASTGAIALYELEGDATSTSSATYNGTATNVAWVPLYDGTPTSMQYSAPSVSAPFLKAGDFNGSNSYISASIPFLNARVTSAVSLWIKYTDTGAYKSVFNDYSNTANFNHNIIVNQPSTGNVRFFSAYGGSSGYKIIESSGLTLNDGNWHHIVSTVDLSTNTLTGYVDGVSVGNVTVSTNAWTGTTQNLQIGRQEAGSYFNGSIDQVRIFNKALDAGEVTQLYNEPNN